MYYNNIVLITFVAATGYCLWGTNDRRTHVEKRRGEIRGPQKTPFAGENRALPTPIQHGGSMTKNYIDLASGVLS